MRLTRDFGRDLRRDDLALSHNARGRARRRDAGRGAARERAAHGPLGGSPIQGRGASAISASDALDRDQAEDVLVERDRLGAEPVLRSGDDAFDDRGLVGSVAEQHEPFGRRLVCQLVAAPPGAAGHLDPDPAARDEALDRARRAAARQGRDRLRREDEARGRGFEGAARGGFCVLEIGDSARRPPETSTTIARWRRRMRGLGVPGPFSRMGRQRSPEPPAATRARPRPYGARRP